MSAESPLRRITAHIRTAEDALHEVRQCLVRAQKTALEEGVAVLDGVEVDELERTLQTLFEQIREQRRQLMAECRAEAQATPEVGLA